MRTYLFIAFYDDRICILPSVTIWCLCSADVTATFQDERTLCWTRDAFQRLSKTPADLLRTTTDLPLFGSSESFSSKITHFTLHCLQNGLQIVLYAIRSTMGERVSAVVKVLCYKPEGRGFVTWWVERICSIYLILLAALGPGVYSAFNRNEYQKQKNNVSGE
jgi:hypothetical protein